MVLVPAWPTDDLNATDTFWGKYMGEPFQTVAADVETKLDEYRSEMEKINKGTSLDASDGNALADTTRALASTINQLPELQEKKRLIGARFSF